MSDILSEKLYEVGDVRFFISSNIETPFIFSRFTGEIVKRDINGDSISYLMNIQSIEESKDWIQKFIHRQTYRMFNRSASRGQLTKIKCFDLTLNMATFNSMFAKRYEKTMLVVPSIFVFENEIEMTAKVKDAIDIMHEHFNESINLLQTRIQTL